MSCTSMILAHWAPVKPPVFWHPKMPIHISKTCTRGGNYHSIENIALDCVINNCKSSQFQALQCPNRYLLSPVHFHKHSETDSSRPQWDLSRYPVTLQTFQYSSKFLCPHFPPYPVSGLWSIIKIPLLCTYIFKSLSLSLSLCPRHPLPLTKFQVRSNHLSTYLKPAAFQSPVERRWRNHDEW